MTTGDEGVRSANASPLAAELNGSDDTNRVLTPGLSQPLRYAANDLSFEDERVDDRADVVLDGIAQDLHGAGIRINFKLANMTAIRKRAGAALKFFAALQSSRDVVRAL